MHSPRLSATPARHRFAQAKAGGPQEGNNENPTVVELLVEESIVAPIVEPIPAPEPAPTPAPTVEEPASPAIAETPIP